MNPDELRLIEHRGRPFPHVNQLVIAGRRCDAPAAFSWVLIRQVLDA